jgi:23S rRNA (guanosine2251-2'-O)-methyltransferase
VPDYIEKKNFYGQLLTIYGRKPVLEALEDRSLEIYKLHLADSNKRGGIIDDILRLAEQRDITIEYHEKKALSRISRNGKQDQGVAADLRPGAYQSVEQFAQQSSNQAFRLIAVDGITNPQNLGMIIRSVGAGYVDGLIIPKTGCAQLSPMVIKASAGTAFKTRILHCDKLAPALLQLKQQGAQVCTLSSHATLSLFDFQPAGAVVYVLGNETDGVSETVKALSDQLLTIPMSNQVESLNVAVTAALIAFTGKPSS